MRKRFNLLLALAVIILFVVPIVLAPVVSAAGAQEGNNQVVAKGAVNKIYNLYATDGYWIMADGTPVYSYGFIGGERGKPFSYLQADGTVVDVPGGPPDPTPGSIAPDEEQLAGNAQYPGPLIYCKVGDVVEIRLKNLGITNPNAPNDPHSLHMHGLDVDAANDGVPETSVATVPANSQEPGSGNVVVYMFTAKEAGTAFYHCHQEASIHVTMGMYGALIIYNANDAGSIYGPGKPGELYGFRYDRDYVFLLSDTDVRQHLHEEYARTPDIVPGTELSVETANGPITTVFPYNPVDFKPQYWFINGLSFPNTVHAGLPSFNWDNWIKTHPGYDPLLAGSPTAKSANGGKGEKILVRMMNLGFQSAPMHCHGFHPKVIGSDQRAWTWASNPVSGKGLEKNTVLIGSGESYDLLFDMSEQKVASTYPSGSGGINGTFPGGTQSRYDEATGLPQSNTLTSFPVIPDPFIFDLYLPQTTFIGGPEVTGAFGGELLNDPPTQIFPYHNHDDYKATNNGVYPGGMFTLIKMLP